MSTSRDTGEALCCSPGHRDEGKYSNVEKKCTQLTRQPTAALCLKVWNEVESWQLRRLGPAWAMCCFRTIWNFSPDWQVIHSRFRVKFPALVQNSSAEPILSSLCHTSENPKAIPYPDRNCDGAVWLTHVKIMSNLNKLYVRVYILAKSNLQLHESIEKVTRLLRPWMISTIFMLRL
jgi:hypothetical protein